MQFCVQKMLTCGERELFKGLIVSTFNKIVSFSY